MNFKQSNYLMDEIMPNTKPAAFKIVAAVARQTWGWGAAEKEISLNDFAEMTGIKSANTIRAAINDALEYINATPLPGGQGYIYSMKPVKSTMSEIDIVEASTISEIDIVEPGTMSEIDTVLCQNLSSTMSEIDITTSGLKEYKEKKEKEEEGATPTPAGLLGVFDELTALTPPHDKAPMYQTNWLEPMEAIIRIHGENAERAVREAVAVCRQKRLTIASAKSIRTTALNWQPPEAPRLEGAAPVTTDAYELALTHASKGDPKFQDKRLKSAVSRFGWRRLQDIRPGDENFYRAEFLRIYNES